MITTHMFAEVKKTGKWELFQPTSIYNGAGSKSFYEALSLLNNIEYARDEEGILFAFFIPSM